MVMQPEEYTENSLIDFNGLLDSMDKAKLGVMWKDSVQHYVLNSMEETYRLYTSLLDGTYKERPKKVFTIREPKEREIMSISFRDRVYQRYLNDNYIYPIMVKSLIYDNGACQKNKGTEFSRNRLKKHMRTYFNRYGLEGYVLQCDVKGYYPNMDHNRAKQLYREKLPKEIGDRAVEILNGLGGDLDKGYNAGSQIVQILGISFLDDLDHFIKEGLKQKLYLRYMDDFIMISHSREELVLCKELIQKELESIGLEFNQKKTKIYKLSDGIKFLGFKFWLSKTGKVVVNLKSENVKRERRKLSRMVKLVHSGKMTKNKLYQCYNSWRSHAQYGDNHNLIKRMDKFLKDMLEDNNINKEGGIDG